MTNGRVLCAQEEVKEDRGKEIFIPGDDGDAHLVLLRQGENLYAYHNECPHQGRPMNWAQDEFLISADGLLVCAHHGASFQPDTGLCVAGPCRGARLLPVSIELIDGQIILAEPAEQESE